MSDCGDEHGWVMAALSSIGAVLLFLIGWIFKHDSDDKKAHERIARLEQRAEDDEIP